jgi:hypothetical protein
LSGVSVQITQREVHRRLRMDPCRVEYRQLRVLRPDQHGDLRAAENDAVGASAAEIVDLLDVGGFPAT